MELGTWRIDGPLSRVPAVRIDLESWLEDILDQESHGVNIGAVFVKVVKDNEREYASRTWLREPESSGTTAGAST